MKNYLKNLFLFQNCSFDDIDRELEVTERAVQLTFDENEIILSYDKGERGIYVIIEGTAEVISAKKHGVVLRRMESGDTFGAASVFSVDNLYMTSVKAQAKCKLILLKCELCEELVLKNGFIAENLIRFLSGRVAFLNRKISAFSAGNAEEKTAIWILSLPTNKNGYKTVSNYTQAAQSLCLGRASLYRALELFEDNDIIYREGRNIKVLDAEKLTSLF